MRRAPLLAVAATAAAGLAAAAFSAGGPAAGLAATAFSAGGPAAERGGAGRPSGPAGGTAEPGQHVSSTQLSSPGGPAVPGQHVSSAQLSSLTPVQAARTERMLERRVACRGCHVIRGRGGRLGPSLDGLGERVGADYVLSVIRDPAGVLPGTTMPRQPMPAREAERLTAYLLATPFGPEAPPPPAADVQPQAPPAIPEGRENDGAALYARHCAACHGPEGEGDGWNAPALPVAPAAHSDSTLMSARPDDSLYDAIAGGAWVLDGSPLMPPFGEMLSSAQIRALVQHIRTLCGCEGPAWSRDGAER